MAKKKTKIIIKYKLQKVVKQKTKEQKVHKSGCGCHQHNILANSESISS